MNRELDRRRFLAMVAVSCGGLGGLACGNGDAGGSAREPARVLRVPLSEIPTNGVIDAGTAGCPGTTSAMVGRDEGGVYAYQNECTHQSGHVPAPDENGISHCCLHGSQFDTNGDLVKGVTPGQASLAHLKVGIEGSAGREVVVVSLDEVEPDRTARVPVPSG